MKKSLFVAIVMLLVTTAANAQLLVDTAGRVGIMTTTIPNQPHKLTVGSHTFFNNNASMGIACSPAVSNKTNVGVLGVLNANSNFSNDKNYGVLGVVDEMNLTHGRNYGISGMIGPLGSHYGGAGVYGTNSTYYYDIPTNIYGDYAGYFEGPVKVSGNLITPNMYTLSDGGLSENIVSIDESGRATLENMLNMDVVEYNLKSRLSGDIPEDVDPERADEVRQSYEYVKKEEKKMTSRRHFGVDAQELQKVYPDLVLEGEDGYLSVNYSELVPLLIRSIQALKQELDEVKGEKAGARKAAQASGMNISMAYKVNKIFQNSPNPFKENTVIRFHLADGVKDADVCIFDMSGKLLKKLPVSSGMGSVSVNGYELGEGMFLYSLLVDGQEVDTKRMILSK